jgi:hypothetical protein
MQRPIQIPIPPPQKDQDKVKYLKNDVENETENMTKYKSYIFILNHLVN